MEGKKSSNALEWEGREERKKRALAKVDSLVPNLDQTQPRHVPAAVGARVAAHAAHGLGDHVGAHGVVGREPAQLDEELVADVVGPRRRHGRLEGGGVFLGLAGRGYFFDAPQLREGVYAVGAQGLDELGIGLLWEEHRSRLAF